MAEKPKIVYSCPRKKDVVTFLALSLFTGIVLFETYLVVILPVQLNRKNAMIVQVEKQRLTEHTDAMRRQMERVKEKELDCEKALVTGIMDMIALYLRDNQDWMSAEQIYAVKQTVHKYNVIISGWGNPSVRRIRRESFDASPYVVGLERKCGLTEKKGQKGK